ncbi:MAG: hypothetical protein IKF64_01315, partial [Eubacterium sp.]|nr:hypothetical protein [Eubacterium sp.]
MKKTLSLALALVMALTSVFCVSFSAFATTKEVKEFSIVFEDENDLTLVENVDGSYEYDEKTEENYFCYEAPYATYLGSKLEVTYTDDSTDVFTATMDPDTTRTIYLNDKEEELPYYGYTTSSDQADNHWAVGKHEFTYGFYFKEDSEDTVNTTVEVEVIENIVESFEFTPAAPYTVIENDPESGEWDVNDKEEKYFWYYESAYSPYKDGNKITVNYKGGESIEYVCKGDEFYDKDDNALPRYFVNNYSDQYFVPWTTDKDNFFTLSYYGYSVDVLITVKHNLKKVPAKAATVDATGNNEYYVCAACGKAFKDANAKTPTTVAAETIAKLTPAPA